MQYIYFESFHLNNIDILVFIYTSKQLKKPSELKFMVG